MSEQSPLKMEKEGPVFWLTLARPEKRNTMNLTFFDTLGKCFKDLNQDPEVRVVVIKAEGKDFTAGMDLNEMAPMLQCSGADSRDKLKGEIARLQESISLVEKCRKPVIAAVHGHCIGGGVDLLSACDIRIAAKKAVFSIRETRIAIIADLGTLQRLPHIIGQGWFRELALTGRDFSAEEALKMGFVTRITEDEVSLLEEAGGLAKEIAGLPPLTVQGVKEVILYSRDSGVYPGLEYVAQKNAAQLPSEDLMEAFKAFMEKRTPEFKGK